MSNGVERVENPARSALCIMINRRTTCGLSGASKGWKRWLPHSDVCIIVDVLSFSTSVDVATARGAIILSLHSDNPVAFAAQHNALLAGGDGHPYSLSPSSLQTISAGERLVLPSPNGSMLTVTAAAHTTVLAGCLRNAATVAQRAQALGQSIAVIGAGERWWIDRTLRPGLEDQLGAGAIIHHLTGTRSPEACAAAAVFTELRDGLPQLLHNSSSGRELHEKGLGADNALAAQVNVSQAAPRLIDGAYINDVSRADAYREVT